MATHEIGPETTARQATEHFFLNKVFGPLSDSETYRRESYSLQRAQDVFTEGAGSFTGLVPLSQVVPSKVRQQFSEALSTMFGSTDDVPVAVVLSRNFYGFNTSQPGGYTAMSLMLTSTGKWIVYVASYDSPQIFIASSAQMLLVRLFVNLKTLGALQHRAGKSVDTEYINRRLRAAMLAPYDARELELIRTGSAIGQLDVQRRLDGLPAL